MKNLALVLLLAALPASAADKLDTICGIFAVGQAPTGSADPFALRRAAIGVLALVLGFVNGFFRQRVQAHVSVHFAVDQVLIHGGQFTCEQAVEDTDDFLVAFHGASPNDSGFKAGITFPRDQGLVWRL